jgi:hypothetical protein
MSMGGGLTGGMINDLFRAVCSGFSAEDKRCMADLFEVDVRTVQRWCTETAEQQRNFIPLQYADTPVDEIPAPYDERARFGEFMTQGKKSDTQSTTPEEQFHECFNDVCEAYQFQQAIEAEEVDPWLSACWRGVKLDYSSGQPCLAIDYERDCISPKVTQQAA